MGTATPNADFNSNFADFADWLLVWGSRAIATSRDEKETASGRSCVPRRYTMKAFALVRGRLDARGANPLA